MRFGGWELVIILVIVIILFGPGRLGKVFGELGSGIRAFKKGIEGDENKDQKTEDTEADSKK